MCQAGLDTYSASTSRREGHLLTYPIHGASSNPERETHSLAAQSRTTQRFCVLTRSRPHIRPVHTRKGPAACSLLRPRPPDRRSFSSRWRTRSPKQKNTAPRAKTRACLAAVSCASLRMVYSLEHQPKSRPFSRSAGPLLSHLHRAPRVVLPQAGIRDPREAIRVATARPVSSRGGTPSAWSYGCGQRVQYRCHGGSAVLHRPEGSVGPGRVYRCLSGSREFGVVGRRCCIRLAV